MEHRHILHKKIVEVHGTMPNPLAFKDGMSFIFDGYVGQLQRVAK